MKKSSSTLAVFLGLISLPYEAWSVATLDTLNTFGSGTVISSAAVNENFTVFQSILSGGTNGQFLTTNSSGVPTWISCAHGESVVFDTASGFVCAPLSGGANAFGNTGNSFGTAAVVGTNDAFPLGFETSGTTKMTILPDGKIGMGIASPTAILDISSTTSGILIPRMTTAQRDTIAAPNNGLQIYNTTTSQLNFYDGTSWQALGVAGAGITSITAGSGLTGGTITTTGTLSVNAGTGASQIVQLDGTARLPAVDGSLLTNLNVGNFTGVIPITQGGTNATSIASARTNLGLGNAAVANLGFNPGDVLPADNLTHCTPGTKLNITAVGPFQWMCSAEDQDNTKLPLAGGSMSGNINMVGSAIINLANPINPGDAVNKAYVDTVGVTPSGAASGDLAGTYPGPTVSKIQGVGVSAAAPSNGQVLQFNGSQWAPAAPGASGFLLGGNTVGSNAVLGTTNPYHLTFRTNSVDRISVRSDGVFSILDTGVSLPKIEFTNGNAAPHGTISTFPTVNGTNLVLGNNCQVNNAGTINTPDTGRPSSGVAITDSGELHFLTAGSSNTMLRMAIKPNGMIGVGTLNPAYPLDVVGDINASGTVRSNTSALTSDLRFKEKLIPVINGLEKIYQLNGYNYYWKDKKKFSADKQLGVIAQEVEKIFPEAVLTDKEGFKSVSYVSLIAPLIEAVKELGKEVKALKQAPSRIPASELEDLKTENAVMKAYLCAKDKIAPFCRQKIEKNH